MLERCNIPIRLIVAGKYLISCSILKASSYLSMPICSRSCKSMTPFFFLNNNKFYFLPGVQLVWSNIVFTYYEINVIISICQKDILVLEEFDSTQEVTNLFLLQVLGIQVAGEWVRRLARQSDVTVRDSSLDRLPGPSDRRLTCVDGTVNFEVNRLSVIF